MNRNISPVTIKMQLGTIFLVTYLWDTRQEVNYA